MSVPPLATCRVGVRPRWRTKYVRWRCVSYVPPTEVWAELNHLYPGLNVQTPFRLWLMLRLGVVLICEVPRNPSAGSYCMKFGEYWFPSNWKRSTPPMYVSWTVLWTVESAE